MDETSVVPQPDADITIVDRISENLGLECIGWIFTALNEKGICLTSYDIRKAARYQEEYSFTHQSGCKISRFITCVVKPNDSGECTIEAYMVSDMCQALERDNIFDNLKDKKLMQVRKPKKNEMLPTVYMENKPTQKFDPDFFIVNLGHGVPQSKKGMNILKTYDFPVAARTEKGIVTEQMIKDYFKKYKSEKPEIKVQEDNILKIDINMANDELLATIENTLREFYNSLFDALNNKDSALIENVEENSREEVFNSIYEKPKVFANNYTISDLELKIANSEFKYENEKYVANILVDMDYSVAKKILPFIKEQKEERFLLSLIYNEEKWLVESSQRIELKLEGQ